MASLTRCDMCSTEYRPEHRQGAVRVERTAEVRVMSQVPAWDVCGWTCLVALGEQLRAAEQPSPRPCPPRGGRL